MDDCILLQLLFSINDNNIMPIKIIRDTPGYEVSIVKSRHRKYQKISPMSKFTSTNKE